MSNAIIPNWLLCRNEVSPGAKVCFAKLNQQAENGCCEIGQNEIANGLGCSRKQVGRYIKELENFGLIESKRRGLTKPNIYRFLHNHWVEERR